jgi:serpin B
MSAFPLCALFAQIDELFSQSSRFLAIDAYRINSSDENWICSPFSTDACLSMIYLGSAGQTEQELGEALHLEESDSRIGNSFHDLFNGLIHRPAFEKDFTLNVVQGLWSQKDFEFLDPFMTAMRENFNAKIESIDFATNAIEPINQWIANQTEQKIQNLLSSADINLMTRLILANAIYFQGSWISPFDPHGTHSAPFTFPSGISKDVEMMHQLSYLEYYEDSDWQAVLLPFKKDPSAFAEPVCVLLLKKNPDAASGLSMEKFEQILASFKGKMVHLEVPQFKLEAKENLQKWLEHLGIHEAFSSKANFSKMNGRFDLYLSKVIQQCFFSFDEQGVEAAAASAAIVNAKCCNPNASNIARLIANRPFEFMLIDRASETCLMVGHVADPLQ